MKFKLKVDFRAFVCHNFWWKMTALVLAIIVWYYVKGEISTGGIKI